MLSGVSVTTLVFAFSAMEPTYAQESRRSSRQEADNVIVLDPIIITARKTDERLQDVPESITVVSPEDLTAAPFASAPAIARNSAV